MKDLRKRYYATAALVFVAALQILVSGVIPLAATVEVEHPQRVRCALAATSRLGASGGNADTEAGRQVSEADSMPPACASCGTTQVMALKRLLPDRL
jgi:hypothetical protein